MKGVARPWSWARWPAFFFVVLIGLAVRLPQLDARPMHTDEAVNAYVVGQLLSGQTFTYDPQDRHGPALAALALPLAKIQGAKTFSGLTESKLRLTSVVAGSITILLFGAATDMLGFVPSLLAALLFAVSPLPVYYDRYFIHEPLFCAATFGLIVSGWHACKSRLVIHAVLAGTCAGLMLACKETAILNGFALCAAGVLFWFLNLRSQPVKWRLRAWPLLGVTGSFVAVLLILFTWFGTKKDGLLGLMRAAPDVLARAGGQGHAKPSWYYGSILTGGWSGALLFALACLGLIMTIRKRDTSARQWLAYYGLAVAVIYSLIPYKTPWLVLSLWLPLAIFAAVAVESLWRWTAGKLRWSAAAAVFSLLAIFASVLIAHDTRLRVFLRPADESNPYAYAHTSDDILGLPAEIADLARRNSIIKPRIAVIASDPWPLPWYLRQFDEVGFWQPGQKVTDADFFVTSTEAAAQYSDRLRDFRPEFFGVRPGELILLWSPQPK